MPTVSAAPIVASTVDTYKDVTQFDGDTYSTFYHENIQLVQKADGSYVWIIHVISDFHIRFADGSKYTERYNTNTVTITAANGDYNTITGFYTERFESFGYVVIFHSEMTYANGETRVNHYWTKESNTA